jgi:uncharacterized spore protein YtfJ
VNGGDVLEKVRDAMTATRVFGEPYEKDGITVIPAFDVRGGGGGGGGGQGADAGGGGGFGVQARPAGAFVIKDGEVRWRPALDWYRLALVGLAAVWIVMRARAQKARAKARAKAAQA